MDIGVPLRDLGPVYTFAEWLDFEAVIAPIVDQALRPLRTPRGVVTRLCRSPSKGRIRPITTAAISR